MNCTQIDIGLEEGIQFVGGSNAGFAAAIAPLILFSLALLSHGELLVRPLCGIVGGIGGFVGMYMLTLLFGSMSCTIRLAVAGITGAICSLLAICLFKAGISILGAAGLGTVAHFIYTSLPLHDIPPPFVFLGKSGYYYATMMASIVIGGIVACCQKKQFIRLSSSLIGGGGCATAAYFIIDKTGGVIPSIAFLLIMTGSSVGGVLLQGYLSKRRKERTPPHQTR
jgi:hypothetical protein